MSDLKWVRGRWPDAVVPPGEPEWLLYELDEAADAVLRSVEVLADGTIFRNSIAIEEREGRPCPSLIDCSIAEGFAHAPGEAISLKEFDELWAQGTDRPFWNVFTPP